VCRWRCTPTRCNCSGLASDAFDMDKHDPKKFKVTPRLYLCNKVDTQQGRLYSQPCQLTSWKWRFFDWKFDLESNIPRYKHNDSWTSIQGYCQCSLPPVNVWMKQSSYEHLKSSILQSCFIFVWVYRLLEAWGCHWHYQWSNVWPRKICWCSRKWQMFSHLMFSWPFPWSAF
jgi:hypothetical protein